MLCIPSEKQVCTKASSGQSNNESFVLLGGRSVKSVVEDNVNAYLLAEEKELAELKEKASPVYQKYVTELGSDFNRLGSNELIALVKYVCKVEKDTPTRHCQNKKKMKEHLGECVPSWTSYFT